MKKLIFIISIVFFGSTAKSQLDILVVNRVTGEGVQGAELILSNKYYETFRSGEINDINEPHKALCAPISIFHTNYTFNAKNLNDDGLRYGEGGAQAIIYAYPRPHRVSTIELPIAKKAKTRNNYIIVDLQTDHNIEVGYLSTGKDPIWITVNGAKKHAYDQLLTATKRTDNGEKIIELPLSEEEYLQEQIFIGLPQKNETAQTYQNLFNQVLNKNSLLQSQTEALKEDLIDQQWSFNEAVYYYQDTLETLRSGINRPIPTYPQKEPSLEPEIKEEKRIYEFPSLMAIPVIGLDAMEAELKTLFEDTSVKYSGDLILKVLANRTGKTSIVVRHMPEGADILIPKIEQYLSSLSWTVSRVDGRAINDSLIIAIKILPR